jgi:hypothetical protein
VRTLNLYLEARVRYRNLGTIRGENVKSGKLTLSVAVASIVAVLSGCASTVPKVDTVRLGDNNMTCEQIIAEVQQMEGLRGEAKSESDKRALATYGGYAALLLAPFTGGLSLLAAGAGTAAAVGIGAGAAGAGDSAVAAQHAHARAQHLTQIFNQKGCKLPGVK